MVETYNGSVDVRSLIFDKFAGTHIGAYRLKEALHITKFRGRRTTGIVMYRPIARQRVGKHILAAANARQQ
jgi:hypothetical protein